LAIFQSESGVKGLMKAERPVQNEHACRIARAMFLWFGRHCLIEGAAPEKSLLREWRRIIVQVSGE
jgi:hypothetical protein